ncbi:hypothetical protein [Legionella hackeliae]|uniref:Secreted protein n=1 Tax=Legionella hackeliae TaxID=449 RepID=A0A0A8UKW1_LEGHA|nr:hypothetical protein [Legionella hackeliae]KTD13531.1 hypothetical protein Lhac_0915 [Legionella hackeliae]CEK09378.1 exported protein of unknown function [Legionella hackeliae]STX49285.1 Uncharacterised protein [Legionella hackeliae]
MSYFLKFAVLCFTLSASLVSASSANLPDSEKSGFVAIIGNTKFSLTTIQQSQLPAPFDFLLTQPLMTVGLEQHYQRSGQIKVIYKQEIARKGTYSRAILMLMDNDKNRNDVKKAEARHEVIAVELALIKMNFKALPKEVINGVLHSSIPFGKLLVMNGIKTTSSHRSYFKMTCNTQLAAFINCKLNSILYGRKNTLNRADNNQWLAHVLEILPAIQCTEKTCYPV